MSIQNMKTHWVADIWPLNESDISDLAEDIKANGQHIPIKALADGSIVDGRNRWLACEIAGVEPIIEVIEDIGDAGMRRLSLSLNEKRRKTSPQQSACAAAMAWKRLFPNGKADQNQGGRGRKTDPNLGSVNLADFAKDFGASKAYTEQALAVLNWSQESFDVAMGSPNGLIDAHLLYTKAKEVEAENQTKDTLISQFDDLAAQVREEKLTRDEAHAVAMQRTAKERADEENMKRISKQVAEFFNNIASASIGYQETESKSMDDHIQFITKCMEENKNTPRIGDEKETFAVQALRMAAILQKLAKRTQ